MGGVWPRRTDASGPPALALGLGMFLLLLFSGILRGATSRVSCTGSTMADRPLAPRQPGRDDVKAPAAGSVLPSRAAAAFFAILRTRSPKDGGAAEGLVWGDDADADHGWDALSAGFACDGRPRLLPFCSPVSGSHRAPSAMCGFRACWGGGARCWVGVGPRVAAASDCLRRSRRIEGMLEPETLRDWVEPWVAWRGSWPDLPSRAVSVVGSAPRRGYAGPSSSSMGETSPGIRRAAPRGSGSGELGGEMPSAPPYRYPCLVARFAVWLGFLWGRSSRWAGLAERKFAVRSLKRLLGVERSGASLTAGALSL